MDDNYTANPLNFVTAGRCEVGYMRCLNQRLVQSGHYQMCFEHMHEDRHMMPAIRGTLIEELRTCSEPNMTNDLFNRAILSETVNSDTLVTLPQSGAAWQIVVRLDTSEWDDNLTMGMHAYATLGVGELEHADQLRTWVDDNYGWRNPGRATDERFCVSGPVGAGAHDVLTVTQAQQLIAAVCDTWQGDG